MSIIKSRQDGEDLRHGLIFAMKALDQSGGSGDIRLADRLEVIKGRVDNYLNLFFPEEVAITESRKKI